MTGPRPVAVQGDLTDISGISGSLVAPQIGAMSITPTVLVMGKPVLTAGAVVHTHGNPYNYNAPGYNPPCAETTVKLNVIPNILVEGKPIAVAGAPGIGSTCICGHVILGPGVPTVLVGTRG